MRVGPQASRPGTAPQRTRAAGGAVERDAAETPPLPGGGRSPVAPTRRRNRTMAEPNRPHPSDVLAVRSRVSWGAITAGAMVALTVYVVLALLGVALGVEAAVRGTGTDLGA